MAESHVLELGKLEFAEPDSDQWAWGKLISAENEEELDVLAGRTREFSKAVAAIKRCSTDPELRAQAEAYEKARMDEIARRRHAIQERDDYWAPQLAAKDNELAAKDNELAAERAANAAKDNELAAERAANAAKDNELTALRAALAALKDKQS